MELYNISFGRQYEMDITTLPPNSVMWYLSPSAFVSQTTTTSTAAIATLTCRTDYTTPRPDDGTAGVLVSPTG